MLDDVLRRRARPLVARVARPLAAIGTPPAALTLAGLMVALGAAVLAARGATIVAAIVWIASRVPDALDGEVARQRGRVSAVGGWFDLAADVAAYAATLVGIAVARPDAALALLVLLALYEVNIVLVAAGAAVGRAEGARLPLRRGLAEGSESIAVHALLLALPALTVAIAVAFSVVVVATIVQRAVQLARGTGGALSDPGVDGPGADRG